MAQYYLEKFPKPMAQTLERYQQPSLVVERSGMSNQGSKFIQSIRRDDIVLERRGFGHSIKDNLIHNLRTHDDSRSRSVCDEYPKNGLLEPLSHYAFQEGSTIHYKFQSPKDGVGQESGKTSRPRWRRASLPTLLLSPFFDEALGQPVNLPPKQYRGTTYDEDPPSKRRKLENDLQALMVLPLNFDEQSSSPRFPCALSSPLTSRQPAAMVDRAAHMMRTGIQPTPEDDSLSSAKQSNVNSSNLTNIKIPSTTYSKSRSSSVPFRERGNTDSQESQKPRTTKGDEHSQDRYAGTQSFVAASQSVDAATNRKICSFRKCPAASQILGDSDLADGMKDDKAIANLLEFAIPSIRKPKFSTAESIQSDRAPSRGNAQKSQVASGLILECRIDKDSIDSTVQLEETQERFMIARNAQNSPSQSLNSDQPHRSYSVDSQGKKIPLPKSDSLAVPAHLNQAEGPGTTTAVLSRRNLRDRVSKKISPTLIVAKHTGGIETAATNPSTSISPKISMSETITFRTPKPCSSIYSTPIKTPNGRSQANVEEQALDLLTGPVAKGTISSRLWKPTPLCDDSVLKYANEAFPGTEFDPALNCVYRTIKAEREGVFRASGVLMGVRFVVGL